MDRRGQGIGLLGKIIIVVIIVVILATIFPTVLNRGAKTFNLQDCLLKSDIDNDGIVASLEQAEGGGCACDHKLLPKLAHPDVNKENMADCKGVVYDCVGDPLMCFPTVKVDDAGIARKCGQAKTDATPNGEGIPAAKMLLDASGVPIGFCQTSAEDCQVKIKVDCERLAKLEKTG